MNEAMGQSRDHTPPENGSLSAEAGMDSIHAGPLGDYGAGTKPDEVVEPGRALALTDFSPPSLGTGERLLRLAYRLGVPAATLAAPFRKPAKTRLLATVLNPLAGQKMAGTAIRAGHFLVHGVKAPIAQIDFAGAARMAPPLERVVHSFAWLADLDDEPTRSYTVVCSAATGQPVRCSCPGFGYGRGKACRHMAASAVLIRRGAVVVPVLGDAGHDRESCE